VFFNGRTVYENNGNNDFVMQIESNMDEHLFEDFLAEEKQKELERLATEEAERRRQTDDQRRREEERAMDESFRAQAKAEVGMKKNKLCNVLRLATTSVENLWYIEPISTGQRCTVRLYYSRNMGLLASSTEIWIHGGYNNWIDGLSFAERLSQHDEKDSEWWFADGMTSCASVCFWYHNNSNASMVLCSQAL
jgi:starch synthase